MTVSHAQRLIDAKDRKAKEKWEKQAARAQRIAKNKRKRELHELGVLHRRLERLRVKSLKQVDSNDVGASHLTVPIPDPEKEAALIEQEQEENLVPEGFEAGDPEKWFVDTQGESNIEPSGPPRTWLQDDFVPFEEEDSSSDESFESFSSIIVQFINSICCPAPSIDYQYKYSVVLILSASRQIRFRGKFASTDQERMRRRSARKRADDYYLSSDCCKYRRLRHD